MGAVQDDAEGRRSATFGQPARPKKDSLNCEEAWQPFLCGDGSRCLAVGTAMPHSKVGGAGRRNAMANDADEVEKAHYQFRLLRFTHISWLASTS